MPNMRSRKTINFQQNMEQIGRQWKVVKLNVVKVVNYIEELADSERLSVRRTASGKSRVFSFERGGLND